MHKATIMQIKEILSFHAFALAMENISRTSKIFITELLI